MSARDTSERTDGGTVAANPGGDGENELLEYITTGRARLVTMFVAAEVIIMLWAGVAQFVLGLKVTAALAAASALLFLMIAVLVLIIWGLVKVLLSVT